MRDRAELYDRINRRTRSMFEAGVLEEIRALSGVELSVTAGKAIGLREIRSHLRGERAREEIIESIQQATRRYAKRQETWFRRESVFQSVCLDDDETADSAARRILERFPHLSGPTAFP